MLLRTDRMKRRLWFYVQLSVIALCSLYILLRFASYPGLTVPDFPSYGSFGGSEKKGGYGKVGARPQTTGTTAAPSRPTRAPGGNSWDTRPPPQQEVGGKKTAPFERLGDEDEYEKSSPFETLEDEDDSYEAFTETVTSIPSSRTTSAAGTASDTTISTATQSAKETETGSAEKGIMDMSPMERARSILPSIMDEEDYTSVDRMWCPPINGSRYDHLKGTRYKRKHHYLIAINLRQCVALLPRLLGSVIETIKFLGPEQVVLSIVEGNSDDGTAEVLDLLKDELKEMGVAYFLNHTALNPMEENRIGRLAMLRDMALAPLVQYESLKAAAADKKKFQTISQEDMDNEDPGAFVYKRAEPAADEAEIDARAKSTAAKPSSKAEDESPINLDWSDEPVVIFLNDVSACAEDILELVHQRLLQHADMTCAMDWTHRPFAAFYDVWVSRTLSGSLFFDMPNGSWDHARKLFPSDPVARARFQAHRPFQVFSCWNGATVFTGKPLIKGEVRFRSPQERECFQGEVQLFCKDMWFNNYGKIAVVPSVNLEYSDEAGRTTKDELGYTKLWVGYESDEVLPLQIDWQGPPDEVLCMPEFHRQSWEAWNESLPLPLEKVANPFGR